MNTERNILIINPKAGRRKNHKRVLNNLSKYLQIIEEDVNIEKYFTTCPFDGEKYVRKLCETNSRLPQPKLLRIYACGGDGTLNEVINGAYGFANVLIGSISAGSGNDFVRNFSNTAHFNDFHKQLNGTCIPIDLIKYIPIGSEQPPRYCINMMNIGFDSNVVETTMKIRQRTFLKGSFLYIISIFINLIKKKGANISIDFDDGSKYKGSLLLCTIANGCFCGGGLKTNPRASINDGKIDICVIKNVCRITFISLLSSYKAGTYLELPNAKDYCNYVQCQKAILTPLDDKTTFCVDGDIRPFTKMQIENIPNAINFIVPK